MEPTVESFDRLRREVARVNEEQRRVRDAFAAAGGGPVAVPPGFLEALDQAGDVPLRTRTADAPSAALRA